MKISGRMLRAVSWSLLGAVAFGSEVPEVGAAQCQAGTDHPIDIVSDGTKTAVQKVLVIPVVGKSYSLAASFGKFADDATLKTERPGILADYAEMGTFWSQATYGGVNLETVVPNCFYKLTQVDFPPVGAAVYRDVYLRGRDLRPTGSIDGTFKDADGNAKLVYFTSVRLKYRTDQDLTVDLVNPTPTQGFGKFDDLLKAVDAILKSSSASAHLTVTDVAGGLNFKMVDTAVRFGSYIDYDPVASDLASRFALGLADAKVEYRAGAADGNTLVVTSENAAIPGAYYGSYDAPSIGSTATTGFELKDASGSTLTTFWWEPLQPAAGGGVELLSSSCAMCPRWATGAELAGLIRPGPGSSSFGTPPPPGIGVARTVTVNGRPEIEFAMNVASAANITRLGLTGGKWNLERTWGVRPTDRQTGQGIKIQPDQFGGEVMPDALTAFLRSELANDGCLTNIAGEVSASELPNGSGRAAIDQFLDQFGAIHFYVLAGQTVYRANAPYRSVEATIPLVAADDVTRTGNVAAGAACNSTAECVAGLTCRCASGAVAMTCEADQRYGVVAPTAIVGLFNDAQTIGHEVGHNLQLPDLYDNSGSDHRDYDQRLTFPGTWDQMADQGQRSHPDVSMKQMRGWIDGRKTWAGADANTGVFHGEVGKLEAGPASVGVEYIMTPFEYSAAEYESLYTVADPNDCGPSKTEPCRKKALILPLALDPSGTNPVPLNGDSRWLSAKFLPPHFLGVSNRQHRNISSTVPKGIRVSDNLAATALAGFGAFEKPISRGLSHTLTPPLPGGGWPTLLGDPIPAPSTPPQAFDLSSSFPAYPGVSIAGIASIPSPTGSMLPDSIRVRVDFNPSLVDLAVTDWRANEGIFASNDIWFSTNVGGTNTPPAFAAGFAQADVGNVQKPIGLPAAMFQKDAVVKLADVNGGAPLNWIHVRVANIGNLNATAVKLRVSYNSPGQVGAPINWITIERRVEANGLDIPSKGSAVFSIPWTPGVVCPADTTQDCKFIPIDAGHTCVAVEVVSWTVAGPTGGVQNADSNPFNNKSQENIFEMDMSSSSPWHSTPFEFEVQNSWDHDVDVRFQTQGLHPGYTVTLSEPTTHLGGLAKRRINGVLHWDSSVIQMPPNQNPSDPFWRACNAQAMSPYPVTAPYCAKTWGIAGWAKRGDAEVPLGGISFTTAGKPESPLTTTVTPGPGGSVNVNSTVNPPGTGGGRPTVVIFIRHPNGRVDTIRQPCTVSGTCNTTFTPPQTGPVTVCTQIEPGGPYKATEPKCVAYGNYERWNGVTGTSVSQIPSTRAPDVVLTLDRLEAPANVANDYGARITGVITAPTTGNYRFFVAGDDAGALYLSSDESPANKSRIAYFDTYTGVREWTRFPSQQSSPIALQAGKRYYIEALVKEGAGLDHLAVGWLKPGDTGSVPTEIVPVSGPAPVLPRGEGHAIYDKWLDITGNAVSQIPLHTAPNFTMNVTRLEGLTNIRDNYGARIRGWLTPPTTGAYSFWIAGDDNVALYLSAQGGPENKRLIASHQGFTAQYEWNKFASQRSTQFYLTAGQRYYFEALMKEGNGGDHFAVGWLKPGQTGNQPSEVIPGLQLSPYVAPPGGVPCSSLPLNRASASASSQESTQYPASKAIDGNLGTRWSSSFSNPQWLSVDLGEKQFVKRVKLSWEGAASADYDIQISDNGSTWTTLYTDAHGNGGVDDISGLAGRGRYVRMYSRARTTPYGNSLYEMEVFGDSNEACSAVLGERFEAESSAEEVEQSGCSVAAPARSDRLGAVGLLTFAAAVGAVARRRRSARGSRRAPARR